MARKESYRDTQIMTASPMELILMLYKECIASLKKAELAFESKNNDRLEGINNHILHAQNIITELIVSLDMEKGGEIAVNLERLYDFMITRLSAANIQKIVTPIKEVRELMTELESAWQDVLKKAPQTAEGRASEVDRILMAG